MQLDHETYRKSLDMGDDDPPILLRCGGGHDVRLNPVLPRGKRALPAWRPCAVCGEALVDGTGRRYGATRKVHPGACSAAYRRAYQQSATAGAPFEPGRSPWYRGPDRPDWRPRAPRPATVIPRAWLEGYGRVHGFMEPVSAA